MPARPADDSPAWSGRYAGLPTLRDVAARIDTLPEALGRMGRAVLARPFRAATLTIDEFAGEVAVSVATANRFARALGFPGYPQFRAELARGFEAILTPVESLRSNLRQAAGTPAAMAAALEEARRNLERTAQSLPHQPCEQAVALVTGARQVLTVGWGSSAYLAGLLQHELEPYCEQIDSLAQGGGPSHAARRLVKRGPRDLLVAIAFPRYVEDTLTLARLARERGLKILALTDEPTSPLVPLADVVLYAEARSPVAPSSNAGVLALIEALVAAVARRTDGAVQRVEALAHGVLPWLRIDGGGAVAGAGTPPPAARRGPRRRATTPPAS